MKNLPIMKLFVLVVLALVLSHVNCTRIVSGGGTETGNPTVSAMLYNPGGSPAAHARVRFYPVNYNPRTGGLSKKLAAADSTSTDANGNYTAKLDTGTYNVLAKGDSGVVYQDSITVVKDSTIHPPTDTLKAPGGIRGRVRLQPGDDARTVLVLFFGTNTWGTPDDSIGRFTVANMAEGTYRVRILTTLDAYVPKDTVLSVSAGKTDSLPHDIVLQYTGIPVVGGLKISYDTLKQIVNLSWNKPTTGRTVKGYNIYRMNVDSNTALATINLRLVTDTAYSDSTGVQDLTYEYRVAGVDTNASEGTKSAAVSVKKVSAYPLIATVSLDSSGRFDPLALAVAPDTTLYVAYRGNGDGFVGMYDKTGHLLRKVGEGMFSQVFDVAIDSRKNIYVPDPDKGLIAKFSALGDSLESWFADIPTSLAIDVSDIIYAVTSNGQEIIAFDTAGNRQDSLVAPASKFVFVKASHKHPGIWAGDYASGNIKHYQANLALLVTLTITQGPSQPSGLRGVDDSELCYVSGYQRPVFVFDATSTLKSWWDPGVYECLAIMNRTIYVLSQRGLGWIVSSYQLP